MEDCLDRVVKAIDRLEAFVDKNLHQMVRIASVAGTSSQSWREIPTDKLWCEVERELRSVVWLGSDLSKLLLLPWTVFVHLPSRTQLPLPADIMGMPDSLKKAESVTFAMAGYIKRAQFRLLLKASIIAKRNGKPFPEFLNLQAIGDDGAPQGKPAVGDFQLVADRIRDAGQSISFGINIYPLEQISALENVFEWLRQKEFRESMLSFVADVMEECWSISDLFDRVPLKSLIHSECSSARGLARKLKAEAKDKNAKMSSSVSNQPLQQNEPVWSAPAMKQESFLSLINRGSDWLGKWLKVDESRRTGKRGAFHYRVSDLPDTELREYRRNGGKPDVAELLPNID